MNFATPIDKVPRIGDIYQKRLKKLGIRTVGELLFHFPRRYEDFSKITDIKDVRSDANVCICGKVLDIENIRTWKKRMAITHAVVEDKTGAIKVVWFNQPYLTKNIKTKDRICLAGKISLGEDGIYLNNPTYEKISSDSLTHTGRIIPVYPETIGLSSRWLRYILKPLLEAFKERIPETLPAEITKEHKLIPLSKALWQIHFPDSLKLAEQAQARFAFEELFFIELFVLGERMKMAKEKALAVPCDLAIVKKFVQSLRFKLTNAQKKCVWQILKDLEKPRPMNRLLEGDVGSGKTVVAAAAALLTMKAGYQAAFMAPTEILVKQHFKEVANLLAGFKLNIGLITGKQDKWRSKKLKNDVIEISRAKLLEKVLEGEIDLLIGTHALIQDKVKFKELGLVILDEQHRFGVGQRSKLVSDKQKDKKIPHLLSMTATPIPRTLALTVYGDLDLSLIDELPKGRKKIITKVVSPTRRQESYEFIKNEVDEGRQVFVICPRIDSNEKQGEEREKDNSGWSDVKAVKEEYEKLSKEIFADLEVAMLHGQMAIKEKERVMEKFRRGKTNVLVSTTVIEVGVDVPNATVIMIEGADRFGLAQLHQLRGRVGRAEHQSYCFLFTDSAAKKTRQRLKAIVDCEDGFALAERDLAIRGPGDFFGTRQWGIPDLAMGALTDIAMVEKTRQAAKEILEQDPGLKKHPLLERRLENFRQKVHLE